MSQRSPDGMRTICRKSAAALLAVFLAGAAGAALGLPDDRNQPIRISADKALRDEKQGFTVYEGNVRMQQGSLRIAAQRITVFHEVEEADRILAEGKPAHLQQQPEPDQAPMHARAEKIEYFKAEDRVLLQRNASIEQDGSKVTGDSIEYLIQEQLIKADSKSGESDRDDGRVEVVIPARTLQDGKATRESSRPGAQGEQSEGDSGAADSQ